MTPAKQHKKLALCPSHTKHNDTRHYAECCYAGRSIFFLILTIIMLNVIMLNAVILSVVKLNDIMQNVIMLNVIMLIFHMLNTVMLSAVAPILGQVL